MSITYLLHQSFRYEYPMPVRELRNQLRVVPPPVHGAQKRVSHEVVVHGAPATAATRFDQFGNHVVEITAPLVPAVVEFESWVSVEREAGAPGIVEGLAGSTLDDSRYRLPSRFTQPDEAIVGLAHAVSPDAVSPDAVSPDGVSPDHIGGPSEQLALAQRITNLVHTSLRYTPGATGVRTTAAEALGLGRGVCQDYAHLMLAVSRRCGLPARYVSGHLLGEGGSHAWVEVLVADPSKPDRAVAVPFDPTHDRRVGERYVTMAVGRDYGDVAPTSGAFKGACAGRLSCRKRLHPAPRAVPVG